MSVVERFFCVICCLHSVLSSYLQMHINILSLYSLSFKSLLHIVFLYSCVLF